MARGRKAAVQAEVSVEEQVIETPVEVTEQEIPVEEQAVELPTPVEEPVKEEENVPTETESEPECDVLVEEEKIEEEKESVPTELKVYSKTTDSVREKEAFVQHLYGNWYGIKAKLRGKIVGISSLGYVSPIKYSRAEAINYAKKINKLRGFGEEVLVVE